MIDVRLIIENKVKSITACTNNRTLIFNFIELKNKKLIKKFYQETIENSDTGVACVVKKLNKHPYIHKKKTTTTSKNL